jgi:hypothetical protein
MIEPQQSAILNRIAGRIAAGHAGDETNLADIKADFIEEVVRECGNGVIQIPSREVIAAEIWWKHVDTRAKNLGQKVIRDFLRGQQQICLESDFHRMVRVSKGRRTVLALYNDNDLALYGVESASNRAMIDASDDELQSQIMSRIAMLQKYGDLQGVYDAGLVSFIDDTQDGAA